MYNSNKNRKPLFALPLLTSVHGGELLWMCHIWLCDAATWDLTCVLICRCHFAAQQQGPILIRADKEALLPCYHSLQTPQAVYGFMFKVYVPHFFCISAACGAKFGPNLAGYIDGVLIGGCQLFLSPRASGRLHYLSNLFNLSNLFCNGREEGRQTDR